MNRPGWTYLFGILAITMSSAFADPVDIYVAIRSGDCALIGDRINQGLDRNEPEAFYLAGYLYDGTACVDDDPIKAMHFYRRALDLGYDGAREPIGLLYALGRGVPQDYLASYPFLFREPIGSDADGQARAIALAYATTVSHLARKETAYPHRQDVLGIEASFDVVLDVNARTVAFSAKKAGIEVGSNVARPAPFVDATRQSYDAALVHAPPIPAGSPPRSVKTHWTFSMRRDELGKILRTEGSITLGKAEIVAP